MFDSVWKNINAVTMAPNAEIINNAAIGVTDGKISYIGPLAELPGGTEYTHDGGGAYVLPALIDCHTHLIYAGSRADEFEQRLKGKTYADIAAAGGGILSTVRLTREADEDILFALACHRLESMVMEGVATVEIKSGYGLDLDSERKMLRAATRIAEETGIRVRRTFLGAHALPPEFSGKDDYIRHICDDMLPALTAEGLIDAVDGFCETIAFSAAQIGKVFDAAQKLGLPVKLHAEQLSNSHGAAMAARYQALSADHLEYLDEAGAAAMAASGTVAVLLPGAYYYLNEKVKPPVDLLRKHNVPMALATDHNPGTSPILSLRAVMNMGCVLFGMTPEEALAGVTRNAARALGLQDVCGTLEVGKSADFALYHVMHPRELCYTLGGNPCSGLVIGGAYVSAG